MKNVLFIILAVMFYPSLIAQNINIETNDFNKLICFKWTISKVETSNEIQKVNHGEFIIEFFNNNKYKVKQGTEDYTGKWSFDDDNGILILDDRDNILELNILKLNSKLFIEKSIDSNIEYKTTYFKY